MIPNWRIVCFMINPQETAVPCHAIRIRIHHSILSCLPFNLLFSTTILASWFSNHNHAQPSLFTFSIYFELIRVHPFLKCHGGSHFPAIPFTITNWEAIMKYWKNFYQWLLSNLQLVRGWDCLLGTFPYYSLRKVEFLHGERFEFEELRAHSSITTFRIVVNIWWNR